MKRHRIQIHVDLENMEKLNKLKRDSGATLSELIRRAIDEYVNNNKNAKTTQS